MVGYPEALMLRPARSIPELAFPFAVVGLAAGWLSAGALANPIIGLSLRPERNLAAILGAVAGAAVGAALTWRCVRSPEERVTGQLAVSVMAGGALTGAAVGCAEAGLGRGLPAGVINGSLCALAFLPVCAVVVAAARRAVRARLGSIVAGADARAVWGILATALAVATLAALPDWPGSRLERAQPPVLAAVMAGGAALLIAGVLVADALALARVKRLGQVRMEAHEPSPDEVAGAVPALDLGLGEEVQAQLARGDAYRSKARALSLLVGSAEQARSALRRALARGAAGLVVASAALGAHAWAAAGGGELAYGLIRCEQRSAAGCLTAGRALAAWGGGRRAAARAAAARAMFERACARGEGHGCAELSRMLDAEPGEADEARRAGEVACVTGIAERCRAVALAVAEREPAAAASLARTGCGLGDAESCRLAPELGDRAAARAAVRGSR